MFYCDPTFPNESGQIPGPGHCPTRIGRSDPSEFRSLRVPLFSFPRICSTNTFGGWMTPWLEYELYGYVRSSTNCSPSSPTFVMMFSYFCSAEYKCMIRCVHDALSQFPSIKIFGFLLISLPIWAVLIPSVPSPIS